MHRKSAPDFVVWFYSSSMKNSFLVRKNKLQNISALLFTGFKDFLFFKLYSFVSCDIKTPIHSPAKIDVFPNTVSNLWKNK